MQNIFYKTALTIAATGVLISCKPKLDEPNPDKGSLDVSKYVAIGNSITAGYADNALYYDGQQVSYANLLAQQLKQIGGGEFVQPLVEMSSVGVGSAGNSRYTLGYKMDCKGVTSLSPGGTVGDLAIFASNIYSKGPFNNMGVPGAKAVTVIFPGYGNPANGFGNYNPFFTRMASNPAAASMLSDAAAQKPTFFSLFIGNNDVLGYASSGGASDAITPSAGAPGTGFDSSIDLIISTMTAGGAKGVVANVPDITNLPYFTTVPYNGLVLDAASAAALNAAYMQAGITFSVGANPFMIKDPAVPIISVRKMKSNELVLLSTPQDSLKCAGWGSSKPINNQYILTETEINNIQTAIAAYNAKLKSTAEAKGLAYVDVNAFMAEAKAGVVYNGISIGTTFVSGGAFSLDGVHLTPLGNALLANEFIKAINSKYGSTIPEVDASKYRGVVFP